MDVRFSEEQLALRDTVARVVDRHGPHAVGELGDTARRDRLETSIADAGWRELRVPDDDGRPLATAVEVLIVAEQLGRGLADVAFLGPVLASELRRRAGAEVADSTESVVFDEALSGCAVADESGVPEHSQVVDAVAGARSIVILAADGKFGLGAVTAATAEHRTDLIRTLSSTDGGARPTLLEHQHFMSSDDLAAVTALGLVATCADLIGVMRGPRS